MARECVQERKKCSSCHDIKELSAFYRQGSRFQSHCKQCVLDKRKRDKKKKRKLLKKSTIKEIEVSEIKEIKVFVTDQQHDEFMEKLRVFILDSIIKV